MVRRSVYVQQTYSFRQGLEPRKQRNESVELFVDLAATQEDHPQVRLPLLIFIVFLRPGTDGQ